MSSVEEHLSHKLRELRHLGTSAEAGSDTLVMDKQDPEEKDVPPRIRRRQSQDPRRKTLIVKLETANSLKTITELPHS